MPERTCYRCGGTGLTKVLYEDNLGKYYKFETCPICGGKRVIKTYSKKSAPRIQPKLNQIKQERRP